MPNDFQKLLELIGPRKIAELEFEAEERYKAYDPQYPNPENIEQVISDLNEFEKTFWRMGDFEPDTAPEMFSPGGNQMGRGEWIVSQELSNPFPYRAMLNYVETNIDGGLLGLLAIIRDYHKREDVASYVGYTLDKNIDMSSMDERIAFAGTYLKAVGNFIGIKFDASDALTISMNLEKVLIAYVQLMGKHLLHMRSLGFIS